MAKLNDHLKDDHGVYFDQDFIMSTCFMEEENKKVVVEAIEDSELCGEQKTNTVCCILCRGTLKYENMCGLMFINHLKNQHQVFFDFDFVLATCFLDQKEKDSMKIIFDTFGDDVKDTISVKTEASKRPRQDSSTSHNFSKKVKSESVMPHKCDQCNDTFTKEEHLKIHVKLFHDECILANEVLEDKQIKMLHKCIECEKNYTRQCNLEGHIIKVHVDRKGNNKEVGGVVGTWPRNCPDLRTWLVEQKRRREEDNL